MPTMTAGPQRFMHEEAGHKTASVALTRALLVCGIAYGVVYVLANDVVAVAMFEGYSRLNQAISELSGTGAPSKQFLRAMLPVFTALLVGFGVGVWRSADGRRALRICGALFLAGGVVGITWLWFPMTTREAMGTGPMAANDVGHLVLSGLTILLLLLQMGFGAAALGTWFRVFTVVAALTLLGFGALTSVRASSVSTGDTPLMGLYERVSFGAWLVWMSAFALVLMRPRRV